MSQGWEKKKKIFDLMFLFMVVIIRTVIFVVNMQTQDYYSSVVLSHSRKQDVILRSYSALITQSFIKYSFIYLFVIPL